RPVSATAVRQHVAGKPTSEEPPYKSIVEPPRAPPARSSGLPCSSWRSTRHCIALCLVVPSRCGLRGFEAGGLGNSGLGHELHPEHPLAVVFAASPDVPEEGRRRLESRRARRSTAPGPEHDHLLPERAPDDRPSPRPRAGTIRRIYSTSPPTPRHKTSARRPPIHSRSTA